MPTVAAFERQLEAYDDRTRAELLAVAERVAAHEFDLLGSGPTELGRRIDWQRDFKSGRSWPLDHISRLVISYPDSSDIKVPWELSRFQHLPVLAAAYRLTGDRRWLDEIGTQLRDWIDRQPGRVRRQLGLHDGRRDPRGKLDRNARARRRRGRCRAVV